LACWHMRQASQDRCRDPMGTSRDTNAAADRRSGGIFFPKSLPIFGRVERPTGGSTNLTKTTSANKLPHSAFNFNLLQRSLLSS
jgi:hypothetical protein